MNLLIEKCIVTSRKVQIFQFFVCHSKRYNCVFVDSKLIVKSLNNYIWSIYENQLFISLVTSTFSLNWKLFFVAILYKIDSISRIVFTSSTTSWWSALFFSNLKLNCKMVFVHGSSGKVSFPSGQPYSEVTHHIWWNAAILKFST